jgi:hypothetical protein
MSSILRKNFFIFFSPYRKMPELYLYVDFGGEIPLENVQLQD